MFRPSSKIILLIWIATLICGCKDPEPESFRHTPPVPVNGKLKGVVELGSYGFNSFVINADVHHNWELKNAEYGVNTVYETDDIKSIVNMLKEYILHIESFGVLNKEIHFVVSSGAIKEPKVQHLVQIIKDIGYIANVATPEQEARYAFLSILPNAFRRHAFVVDIGSGNTKLAWEVEKDDIYTLETVGARYLQQGITDRKALEGVMQQASLIPQEHREICFIIGGIPYEMALQYRKNKERYTVLRHPSQYRFDDDRKKSGVNIYKTIRETTGCERFVFDWNGNFAIGFLLSSNF